MALPPPPLRRSRFSTSLLSIVLVLLVWLDIVAASLLNSTTVKGRPFPRLIDATLDDLSRGLSEGLFTSVDLTKAYLARIVEVNPQLHAVTEINPDALAIAAEMDALRGRGGGALKGPLHGIPVLIKNNIATADDMNNTAGSLSLLGATVPRDAHVAKKLREAGAVILGKANLSQWANFRSSNSSSGWSAHGGQCLGVYFANQDPSGSSSGSGVSASLGLAAATLGTETDGSILSPSMRGSLVGIKPTVGLTSRDLVIPISEHQDTVGPMARTVRDAARVLGVIAGVDENDNYTSAIPNGGKNLPDYLAGCSRPLRLWGARIGVPANVLELISGEFGVNASTDAEFAAFSNALEVLRRAGAEIVEDANFTAAREALTESQDEIIVLRADFISNLAGYFAKLSSNPRGIRSLADMREFVRSHPVEEEYPDRNTATWDDALDVQEFNNSDPRFWEAYQRDLFLGGDGGLLGAIERYDLDAVVLPSSWASSWAAIVGAPAVTVPMGYYPDDAPVTMNRRGDLVDTGPGVPFGLSFLGAHFTEEKLIALAYAFEQRTLVRDKRPPVILPKAEIGDFAGY